jgi:hypothetical protein
MAAPVGNSLSIMLPLWPKLSISVITMVWFGAIMVDTGPAARLGAASSAALPCARRTGAERPALDLVIVQDDSESMYGRGPGTPPALRLEAARLLVSQLGAHARVAFVGFGAADRSSEVPLVRIDSDEDRRAMIALIEAATFEKGRAHYPSALRSVIDALADGDRAYGWPPYRAAGRKVGVLFLSDGHVSDQQQLDELLAEGGICELMSARGCPVHTIGIGSAARDAGVLREIAATTGGSSRVATDAHELRAACRAVIAQLGEEEGS